jgi:tetratricopeptide (TPR) repeat protein
VSRQPFASEKKSSEYEAPKVIYSMTSFAKFTFRYAAAVLCSVAVSMSTAMAEEPAGNPETLPMFGQPKIARSESLKKADEDFIRDNTLRYKTRQAASNAFAVQGWSAIRARQPDVAMLRFNQAWLLNAKNYSAFWGFGAVFSERGRLAEAIEHLETARELIDDPTQRPALLADLGALHSEYAVRLAVDKQLERAHHFVIANARFTESLENDPRFASGWREWAMSLYDQERYSEAWVKAKRARELKAEPFPPEFIKKLSAKMPEPK